MGSVQVVRGSELPDISQGVSTEKWTRRVKDVDDLITLNAARNEPGAISQWHMHGENTGYVYVLQGQVRLEWGPGGSELVDLAAGDFYVIAPNTVHREANPGSEEQILIAFPVGTGPKFIDADGPPADGATGSIRVFRGGEIPEGPATPGMVRKVAHVDEGASLGWAGNGPHTTSDWHSHGARTTCAYVVRGRLRLDWGPQGEGADLDAGDFYVLAPGTIHREGNPGDGDNLLVGFYLGEGEPTVVKADGPGPA